MRVRVDVGLCVNEVHEIGPFRYVCVRERDAARKRRTERGRERQRNSEKEPGGQDRHPRGA